MIWMSGEAAREDLGGIAKKSCAARATWDEMK